MIWQDSVFSAQLLLLTLTVIPTIRDQAKRHVGYVPYTTSVFIAILETSMLLPLSGLQLWFSAFSAVIIAGLWGIVALQRFVYGGLKT